MSVKATMTVSMEPSSTAFVSSSRVSMGRGVYAPPLLDRKSSSSVETPPRPPTTGGDMSTRPDSGGYYTSEDEKLLHKLGYAQELFRAMGGFQNFAISFTIISI